MDDMIFSLAAPEDASEVLRLYKSLVGTPGCTWNEYYPDQEVVHDDIAAHSLYILRDGAGAIVAAAAAGPSDELEHDNLRWNPQMKKPCDLARVGVAWGLQGKGIGNHILQSVMREVRERGFDGIRMLVNKNNAAALALYRKNGFTQCGEVFKFDRDFFCYEILL